MMRPSNSRRFGCNIPTGNSYAHREEDDDEDDDAENDRRDNVNNALDESTLEGADSNAGSSYTTETVSISAITQDSYFQSEATVSSSSSSHNVPRPRTTGGNRFLYPFTNQLGGDIAGNESRLPRHAHAPPSPYESEDEPSYQERQEQQQEQQTHHHQHHQHHRRHHHQQQQQQQHDQNNETGGGSRRPQHPPRLNELHHHVQRHAAARHTQQTSYYGGRGLDTAQGQSPYPPSSYGQTRRRHSTIEEEQEHVPQQQHFPLHEEEDDVPQAPPQNRRIRRPNHGSIVPPIAHATAGHESPNTSIEGSGGTNSDGVAHSSITMSLPSSTGATNSYTPTMSSVSDSLSFNPPNTRPVHPKKRVQRPSQGTGTGSSSSAPQPQSHHQGFRNFPWKTATSQSIHRALSGKSRSDGNGNTSQLSYSSSSSKSSSTKKQVLKSEESASTSGGSSIFSLSSFRISVPSSLSSASRSVSTYSTSSSSKSDPLDRLSESEGSSPTTDDIERGAATGGTRTSTGGFITFSALPRYGRDSSGSTVTSAQPQKTNDGRRPAHQPERYTRKDSASTSASSVMDRQVVTNNEQRRKVLRTRIFNNGRRPSFSTYSANGKGDGMEDATGESMGSFGSNISNHKNGSDDFKKRGKTFSIYDKTASTSKLSSVLSSIADVSDEGATSSSGAGTISYNTGSVAGDYYTSNSNPNLTGSLYHDGVAPTSSRSGDSTILRGTSGRKVNFRISNDILPEEAKLDIDQEHQRTIVSGTSSSGAGKHSDSRSVRSSRSPQSGLNSRSSTSSGGPRTSATMAMSAYQNRVDAFIAERQGRLENERMLREAARIRTRAKRHVSSSSGPSSSEDDVESGESTRCCCSSCKWNPMGTKLDACITIAFVQALLAFIITILYFEVSIDDVRRIFGG